MKPLPTTIPVGWTADGWLQYLWTRAHSSDEHFPEVAKWFRDGADAVEMANLDHEVRTETITRLVTRVFGEEEKERAKNDDSI